MDWLFYSKAFLVLLEIISFITALWTFRYHNAVFRLFFFNLLFISVLESSGLFVAHFYPRANFLMAISSLFIIVEIPIIYFCALKLIPSHLFQKLMSIGFAVFLFLWVQCAWRTKLLVFPTIPFLYASTFALIIFLTVLMRMIGQNNIFKQPLFYFCLGMIIFYGCIIPYLGVVNYFVTKDNNILIKLVQIFFVSNYIRYSLLTVAYIMLARDQKKKLQQTTVIARSN